MGISSRVLDFLQIASCVPSEPFGTLRGMWNYSPNGRNTPFAHEAELDAADNPAHALSALTEQLAEVRSLVAVNRPEYEYTGPRAWGGIGATNNAVYSLTAPFTGPCEVLLYAASATNGTTASYAISTDPQLPPDIVSYNAGTSTLPGNDQFLILLNSQVNVLALPSVWFPLSGAQTLYLHVPAAYTHPVYVTAQFRRRINPAGVPSQGYP